MLVNSEWCIFVPTIRQRIRRLPHATGMYGNPELPDPPP